MPPPVNDPASLPEHIFLSHSSANKGPAQKLAEELKNQGVPVWIDFEGLTPGTPHFEQAIRAAMDRSFAVVFLASPAVKDSSYVPAELALAKAKKRRIFPVWIDGTDWVDCTPLDFVYAQHIDLRGERWGEGVAQLASVLTQFIHDSIPKHYRVKPSWRVVQKGFSQAKESVSPPAGFVAVELSEGAPSGAEQGGEAAFFRASQYTSLRAFLDELYIAYLRERFQPNRYGTDWVLEEVAELYGRVLAPWSWLHRSANARPTLSPEWQFKTSLAEAGVRAGSRWTVRDIGAVQAIGFAANDARLYEVIRANLKAEYSLRERRIIAEVPIEQSQTDYRVMFPISCAGSYSGNRSGKAIVQTGEPISEGLEQEIAYWLKRG